MKSRSATPPQVFIGPTLPQLTPEEVARGKVIKFEESMAQEIQKDILKEEPLDWVKSKVHRGLYSKPFAWKKSAPCTSTYNDIQAALKKSKESISLIAGNYADDSETDEDAESPLPNAKKKNRQGVHVKVQKPTSKQAKPLLKEIPGIFKANDDSDDENENINATGDNESDGKSDDQPPKKKGRWDMKDRLCFGKMCLKLEALEVAKIPISPLKLLAVQVETLFAAWQNGALSNSYLQTTLEKLSNQMTDIENHHLAPPGWRAVWDRSAKKYAYENLITREMQFEKPLDEDEETDEELPEDSNPIMDIIEKCSLRSPLTKTRRLTKNFKRIPTQSWISWRKIYRHQTMEMHQDPPYHNHHCPRLETFPRHHQRKCQNLPYLHQLQRYLLRHHQNHIQSLKLKTWTWTCRMKRKRK